MARLFESMSHYGGGTGTIYNTLKIIPMLTVTTILMGSPNPVYQRSFLKFHDR